MKKIFWVCIGVVVLVVGLLFLRGNEDSWVKDSRGVYVKHGSPDSVPDYVTEQQTAINCANELYNKTNGEGAGFNSQCLGTCGDYDVDVVHVPRNDIDNLVENQCPSYREGIVGKFIELDKNGEIVRII